MRVKFMESIDGTMVLHFAEANDVAFVPKDPDVGGSAEIIIILNDKSWIIPLCEDAFAHLSNMADGIHMDFGAYSGVSSRNINMNDISIARTCNDVVWAKFKEEVNKDVR